MTSEENTQNSYDCFINSILQSIRTHHYDYCYYSYQVAALLKYEKRLKVELCCKNCQSPYYKVWLYDDSTEWT